MKWMLCFLLLVLLLFSFVSCREIEDPQDVQHTVPYAEMGTSKTDFAGVLLKVDGIEIIDGKTTLKTTWVNETEHKITYGEYYKIERLENGTWVSTLIAENLVFHDIAYILEAKQSREESYALTNFYDITKAGTYRIITDCSVHDLDPASIASTKCTLTAEFTVLEQEQDTTSLATEVPYDVQYIRTNGYHEGVTYPFYTVVSSVDELNAYYESYKDRYDLARRETVSSDSTVGFLDACDRYDEAFFEKDALLLVVLEEGSGSIRHKVTDVTKAEGYLSVSIESIVPEVCTCDMAEWHIMIAIDKDDIPMEDGRITIYYNGEVPSQTDDMPADDGIITEEEAVTIAKEKVNVEYDKIEVHYFAEDNCYLVYFKHSEMVGGYRLVYVSTDGEILDVLWDA